MSQKQALLQGGPVDAELYPVEPGQQRLFVFHLDGVTYQYDRTNVTVLEPRADIFEYVGQVD